MAKRTNLLKPIEEKSVEEKSVEKTVKKPDLKALLEQEQQERVKKCAEEIDQVLRKHNCILDAVVIVSARGNVPQIQILLKD
jgi:hypothetical protein